MRRNEGLAEAATRAGLRLVAALYGRVSQDKRDDQRSVDDQDTFNRAECVRMDWEIGGAYADPDLSASRFATKARPDWDALLADLAAGRFHVLVLWEASRGDRTLHSWIGLLDLCRDLGIWIHVTSHSHTYDLRRRRDYKTLAEEGIDSADEVEKTSERLQRTMEGLAMRGMPHAHTLWGYRREYAVDNRGRRILVGQFPDIEPRTAVAVDGTVSQYTRAAVIAEMAERVVTGEAALAVAVDLNRRGIPTPLDSQSGWTANEVRRRVTNPAYAGLRAYRGRVVGEAIWEAIIKPPARHHILVAKFADPTRRLNKDTKITHLGSGLYLCGECGSIVRTATKKNKTMAPSLHYMCWPLKKTRWKTGPGHCVSRRANDVDAFVQRAVWLRLAREDIAELLAEDTEADAVLDAVQAEIAEKQLRLDQARDSFAAGKLPIEGLERVEADLGPEIERARASVRRARLGPVLDGLILPTIEEIEAEWWRRSLSERREVIRALTLRVEILRIYPRRNVPPEESVRIVWRTPRTGSAS